MSGATNRPVRTLAVAVVALAAVFAGCAGFGATPATPTVTPAEVSDGERSDTGEDGLPPGVSDRVVFDPAALGAAHMDHLEGRSFTLVSNRTVRYANESVRSRLAIRIELARDRTYHAWAATTGPQAPLFLGEPPTRAEYWSDGFTYLRASGGERHNRTYNEFDPPQGYAGTWRYWTRAAAFGGGTGNAERTIRSVFGSVDVETVDRQTVNGTTLVRLRATEQRGSSFAPETYGAVSNVSVVAVVEESGLVRSLEYRYDAVVDRQTVSVRRVVRYTNVTSTTVDRPSWYDRAVSGQQGRST